MKKILIFFSCFIMLPVFSYADTPSETQNIDAETNISAVQESIKFNDEEFNKIAEQIAKRYPNFDWIEFDKLDAPTKRIVLKNYLARLAFEEVKEKYIKDINARAKDGVTIEKRDNYTYYYNKSDEKYRTNYITGRDLLKKANISSKCEGSDFLCFKQTDVEKLDKLIKQETAKAPVDMHCEKYCVVLDQKREDVLQESLTRYKNYLNEYNRINQEYLADLRKIGIPRQEIKKERKKLAEEMNKEIEKYNRFEQSMTNGFRSWNIEPYTKDCKDVIVGCWNVEKIPQNYDRFELKISNSDDDSNERLEEIRYEYTDAQNNKNIVYDSSKMCSCTNDNFQKSDNFQTSVYCQCIISFYDVDQDFTKVRNWENQNLIDIKNGMMQDLDENGKHKLHWDSAFNIPMGKVFGRVFDFSGMSNTSRDTTDEN